MKKKVIGSFILPMAITSVFTATSFAETANIMPVSAKDVEVMPISYQMKHWSEGFIDQLSKNYDVMEVFGGKNLNSIIEAKDFDKLVKLVLDENYNGSPDSVTREAVVHELMQIWADKTGKDLDKIPVIKMLIYVDLGEVDTKYYQSIMVAYMKDVAKGRGEGIFDPKTSVTYGELATLIFNTAESIEKEKEANVQPIAKERFETRGNYEIKDDKVVFDFELMSHYTEAKELMFGSGQQFEVTITDEKGNEVYRFSEGKFFTLALVPKTINPGEAIKWQDEWDMTDKEGNKLTTGKYQAKIEIMVIQGEEEEKIEESQLSTVVEFELGVSEKSDIIESELAKEIIKETADKLINAISVKDAKTISELTHPVKGVRFTPYTYVSLENDLVFKKDEIQNFFEDKKDYLWGQYDGTGDDISLTPGEYYEKFIYPADFKDAEKIGYNEVLSSGNMLENQFEVYDNPIVVEYYFSGFNPDYEGLDWRSLRLVFEEYEGTWYLVGIINNQWTI
ncbi:BsuPI-related putative proteinase inhibitor [Acetivibrio mesophilus]|uniref:SLH domain-containing protein n=1 Tax=Acetivibrio mesophilus TaxID=2487273 RepID=A0A4Q0I7N3_9FIRM|nr:BsuPI-related putative proteinase inhibitor [Acetivibrio mesophilus]RXE59977.1 hypothetical protein EFD62_04280 [Acetivibrio mesophilus]